MLILNYKCEKCNHICYAIQFQQNFINWTSGNKDIDKFIRDAQKIGVYRANWIDGFIDEWNDYSQNWDRCNQNMVVTIKRLNNSKAITLEFIINKIKRNPKLYGLTQDPETQSYMVVLSDKCRKCHSICDLSVHKDNEISHALEWIPYNRFYDIKYIEKMEVYRANWIDGYIYKWDDKYQNLRRLNQDMLVTLKDWS
uniref:Uncharacterized protein n=1 Tax=Rhizophagus irregularis (strain DAOM 181602 / DAOM 197198 / MUCL 43194) TaxID=747089 RepID=U9SLJ9_RHIID